MDSEVMSIAASDEEPQQKQGPSADLGALLKAAGRDRDEQLGAVNPFARMMGNDAPQQLDPEQGPIDLGLRFNINFGASEPPYDDAMQPIDGVVPGRAGFSDSVLQLSWRERVGKTYGIHGTAALSRFQDDPIIDGLPDSEFAWFVVGIYASF